MAAAKASPAKLHPTLAKFLAFSEKRKLDVASDVVKPKDNIEYISTGSTIINLLIGGTRMPNGQMICPGWPKGRISEVYGKEGSGKSTVALMGMAQAIAAGGTGVYVDAENAVVDSYARKLGVDFRPVEMGGPGNAIRVSPPCAEDIEAYVLSAALMGVSFIVVDSVAAMVPRKENLRNSADEKEAVQIAELPRIMSRFMPKLQNVIAKTGTHVMFLNQVRDKIGAMGYTEEAKMTTTGGNALRFYSSLRFYLKAKMVAKAKKFNVMTKEWDEVPISTDVLAKGVKNKIDALQGHSMLFTIRYGIGIDELRSMLNVATAYKIVKQAKNARKQDVFTFVSPSGTTVECISIEKFRSEISAPRNKQAFQEMITLCHEAIVSNYKPMDDSEIDQLEENAFVTELPDDGDDFVDDGSSTQEVSPESLGESPIIDDDDPVLAQAELDLDI